MEDSQRKAMYDAWLKTKIYLEPKVIKDENGISLSVIYENKEYTETFLYKDLYGSTNAYNLAFNRLLTNMKKINKNIELQYDIFMEF